MIDVEECLRQLNDSPLSFEDLVIQARSLPGIYALCGSAEVWLQLGLGEPPDARPLYVGKSESSLVQRPLGEHFDHRVSARSRSTSLTGWSTPRRTLAALLRDELRLRACPRNLEKLGAFDRFGLAGESDQQLTDWMRTNLRVGLWYSDTTLRLKQVEDAIVSKLNPPLNCTRGSRWYQQISDARKVMVAEAKTAHLPEH